MNFMLRIIAFAGSLLLGTAHSLRAQNAKPVVRIASLTIDSAQLSNYQAALRLHAETAVRKEPGVLNLYAVYEKDHPTHVTVFEIYASPEAYQAHLKTAHFLKYKTTTQAMVKSLQLTETVPIALENKSGSFH